MFKTQVQKSIERIKDKKNPPHLIIQARAGTGKTTTLIEGLKILKGQKPSIIPSPQQLEIWEQMKLSKGAKSICFCAFNTSIADELKRRVPPGVTACTMHSLGNRAVVNHFNYPQMVKDLKTKKIICELLCIDNEKDLYRNYAGVLKPIQELTKICKMCLTVPTKEEIDTLIFYYDIEVNVYSKDLIYDLMPKVMNLSLDVPKFGYDFSDMIYIPMALNLPLPRYDLLLVDEAQDLNTCQQDLSMRVGERIIYVGDDRQAIYGFAGADTKSLLRMKGKLEGHNGKTCRSLPLTVTRRCGKQIVEEAKIIVPDFEAYESNPNGEILETSQKEYQEKVKVNDMILSRTNGPLVIEYFFFLKKKLSVRVQGKNIGEGLINLLKKLGGTSVEDLVEKIYNWASKEEAKVRKMPEPDEGKIILIHDKRDCLLSIVTECNSLQEVETSINVMFSDDSLKECILLSSIHKAKGLEAKNVFILQYDGKGVPHPLAKTDWQREQEQNLLYVAITRAIERLYYVYGKQS